MKVSICCLVYNHAAYLEQALNGFLSQKTAFDFEIVVGEDCSTDNSRAILQQYQQQYPDKVKLVLHDANVGVTGNFLSVLNACTGEYFAMCEGDDYWDNSTKLQQQVDFLDENKNYSICWTQFKVLKDDVPEIWPSIKKLDAAPHDVTMHNLFDPYVTYTLTAVLRKSCLDAAILAQLQHFKDNSIYFLCLQAGLGRVMNFYGAVYRLHGGGIFSATSQFGKNAGNYWNYKELVERYPQQLTANIINVFRGSIIALIESYPGDGDKNKLETMQTAYRDLMLHSSFYRKVQFTLLYFKKKRSAGK